MLIDKNKDTSKLYLILCGSSMSFMENHVLAYKAPLYGRRTAQFKIEPFDFFESRKYFKDFSNHDMALIYGIVGGTPQYLLQMDDSLSVEDNIKNTCTRKVVGFKYGLKMTADLVLGALSNALRNQGNPKNIILHSDRGSQYTCNDYTSYAVSMNI